MYNFKKCVMGLAPTRRDVFPASRKDEINKRVRELAKKYDVEIVDIDDLTEGGLLVKNSDVPKIARKFADKGVDCVFIPHANFGQEEAAAKLCAAVGKPVLLWGPRDPAPKGVVSQLEDRLYDVQCGLFATGKALIGYGVPFTYIENCWPDSEILDKGFGDFIRTVCAVKAVKGARIAQLSVRPAQFLSVRTNEQELLEKFGIEVVPFETTTIIASIKDALKNDRKALDEEIARWKKYLDFSQLPEEALNKSAATVVGIRRLVEDSGCNAAAGECWKMLRSEMGISACFAWGALTTEGIPTTCETDLLGAVGSAMMAGVVRGDTVPFFADITVRHPTNENAELLWHCGPFPYSLAKSECNPAVIDCKGQFEIHGGDLTLLRWGCAKGRYTVFADECRSTEGPKTNGTYIWIETDNWPKWERKFVTGPYIHHVTGAHGKYQAAIHEALKYLGEIYPDSADL
jgi:L-fucose isomerase-like protein